MRLRIMKTTASPTATPTLPPGPPAVTSCAAGLTLCCQCGIRYPPLVGSPAPAAGQAPYAAYPWQAVLLTPSDVYIGCGALINYLHVLTVAHRASQYVNAPSTVKVLMGEWNAEGDTEPIVAQEYIVSKIFIHPNYNAANLKNDIAILRLATVVPLGNSPGVATGCLPTVSFVGLRL